MAGKDIEPRVRVPKKVQSGEVFQVKCVVKHNMETGRRRNRETGEKYPREIINRVQVQYGGKQVLDAIWHPAVSANPFTSFYLVAGKSGPMKITWIDDNGAAYSKTVKINVV